MSPARSAGAGGASRRWPLPLKFAVTFALVVGFALVVRWIIQQGKVVPVPARNMNGLYEIANPPEDEANLSFESFNTDFASKGLGFEFFDIYSPEIATKYGEVFWRGFPELALPEHIIRRFSSNAIAIVGYEHDQVFVRGGPPGARPDLDISVPFGWAYNHHYELFLLGSDAVL